MSEHGKKNPKGKTRDVNAAQRAQLALRLRAQRLPWDVVAAQAGFASKGAAHNAVMRELQRNIVKDVELARQEELALLDELQAKAFKRLEDPRHDKAMLFAVDRLLQISERRSKLLGLDAPTNGNVFAAQVIVREAPPGLLGEAKQA